MSSKFTDRLGKAICRRAVNPATSTAQALNKPSLFVPKNQPRLLLPPGQTQTTALIHTDASNSTFSKNPAATGKRLDVQNISSAAATLETTNATGFNYNASTAFERTELLKSWSDAGTARKIHLEDYAPNVRISDDLLSEDATPLETKYWTGKPAIPFESFQIDVKKCGYDLDKIFCIRDEEGRLLPDMNRKDAQELRAHMWDVYERIGAVHLINTGLTSSEGFNAAVKVLFENHMSYRGGANMRAPIEGNVYDTGAPREANIQYHHEMAYVSETCKWVAFGALEATNDPLKGASFLSDNIGATNMLMDSKFGQKLRDKGVCYIRKLPDQKYFLDNNLDSEIVYNFWQTSTGTDDPEEAAKIMEAKGLQVEWEDSPLFGRYLVTKYYVDTFEYDPYNDRNTMFASVADDYAWFDYWPGVKDLPHWERPLKLTFGDDSVMTRAEKQYWVDCYDNNGFPLLWKKGDLGICCNYRTAHGRPAYELEAGEKRDLGVILGEPVDRVGEVEGK